MHRTLFTVLVFIPLLAACGGGGGGSADPVPDLIPEVQAPGAVAAAPMHFARRYHNVVVLADGRVLVVGGTRDTSRGEIYDPGTDTWTLTAEFAAARLSGSAAVRMADGRVFVSSGSGSFGVNEIYDPAGDTVTSAPGFTTPRRNHRAIRLLDGRILLAGGRDADFRGDSLDTMEIYNPVTNQMRLLEARMLHERNSFLAQLLLDGRVLMTAAGSSVTDLFDPVTETLVRSGANFGARHTWQPVFAQLTDGRILVPSALSRPEDALIYDVGADAWGSAGAPREPRSSATVTALLDGRAIMIGGSIDVGPVRTGSAEIFDAETGSWVAAPALPIATHSQQAVLLLDGRILLCGGSDDDGDTAAAWLYQAP